MSAGTTTTKSQIVTFEEHEAESSAHNTAILDLCSQHLRKGGLVAFPTETVYGLGANALDEAAVYSIFDAKKRPLTDPVIVHVLDVDSAIPLISINDHLLTIYRFLAAKFWPGPLTMVTRANDDKIPSCVTAETGFVGVRCPEHDLARKLLKHSGVAIAAPSANRFGHVSPTRAQHVMDDLGEDEDHLIYVLKSSYEEELNRTCRIGIESTVVKVDMDSANENSSDSASDTVVLYILRRGGVSVEQLQQAAREFEESTSESNPFQLKVEVRVVAKDHSVSNDTTQNQSSPGQMLTHYAPYVPAYLLRSSNDQKERSIQQNIAVNESVIVDFGGKLSHLASSAIAYMDLSPSGDVSEARTTVFKILRESEKVESAKLILLPNLMELSLEHADSLFDRLFRAASGKYAELSADEQISVLE